MKKIAIISLASLLLSVSCSESKSEEVTPPAAPDNDVNESGFVFSIDATKTISNISPYIYGINHLKEFSFSEEDFSTMVRFGGNRTTGYNWENNASNAGSDWHHSSDNNVPYNIVGTEADVPGSSAATFINSCLNNNKTPLFTIPMCYSVAADKKGDVAEGDATRWVKNIARKNTPFQLVPDLEDGCVYADELVNFITHTAGGNGKVMYSLDNEPDLWHSTHPRICPEHIKCVDFLDRTIEFASAIKDVDPGAQIFGFVSFGYSGFNTFSSAPDWNQLKSAGGYEWFIDYFLDRICRASRENGKTLIDVLDLHWYPEAKGDNRITYATSNTAKDRAARLQAFRSLWDTTYKEESWITQQSKYFLPLLPMVKKSIDRYCPGIKLSITEFNYGGYEDISGTIALADVLGTFGKYDIFAASHWGSPGNFGKAAYRLYRDYDGNKSTFGDYLVASDVNKTWVNTSIYASSINQNMEELHIIVTNKNVKDKIDGKFKIKSEKNYTKATVYYVAEDSYQIKRDPVTVSISGNTFSYKMPAMSVAHIIVNK